MLPDEGLPPGGVGDEGTEPGAALVPAADGKQGLEVLVVGLERGEGTVSTWQIVFRV